MSVRRNAVRVALLWAVAGMGGCSRKDGAPEKTADAPALASAPETSKSFEPSAASVAPDYLVPPTQYGDSDLIRALYVDKDQVYFATLSDVYRVPLAGGTPVSLSKTPGTTLSGQVTLWGSGERLLMQSTGESIFMESPKAGGRWTTFLDLSSDKVGGGRDAATRILQGLGKGGARERTMSAEFDGHDFYFSVQKLGPKAEVLSSSIVTVPLAGGKPKVLLDTPGTISEVHRLGERIVFMYTKLPSAAALAQYEKARQKDPYTFRPNGPSGAFVLDPGQGEPRLLMAISHVLSSAFMVGDESQVILSGFEEGSLKNGGIYRVPLAGGAAQMIEPRALVGQGFVFGDAFVISGVGPAKKGTSDHGEVTVVVPKKGGAIRQVSALVDRWTTQARAVSAETLLLARYSAAENRAAIQRVSLSETR